MSLRESALRFLRMRNVTAGEIVQVGWFVFRTTESAGGIDLETLDFKKLASFTTHFHIPEQIHWAQQETLQQINESALPCSLADPALVSRSYQPGSRTAFLERCHPVSDNDCGWYVGVTDESLDLNDPDSFIHQSLYELTIHDQRFARFWLLPAGYRVFFDATAPRIEKVPAL